MANNGVIKIIFEEGSNKTPGPKPINDKMSPESDKNKDADILKTAALSAMLYRAGRQLKDVTIDEVKRQIDLNFALTDNYMARQNMNIALGIIDKAGGAVVSIGTGFAIAGPVGAVIGAGLEVVKTGLNIFHNYQQETINLHKMNVQLEFNRQRAGYSLTVGARGENR